MLASMLFCAAHRVHASGDTEKTAYEPTVTREEAGQIASASSLFDKNPSAAIRQLREHTRPKASAALDFALAAMLAKEGRLAESENALNAAVETLPTFQRAWLLLV
jgi:hypothetical protein